MAPDWTRGLANGSGLPWSRVEQRFVIERVDLRRPAVHEQEDDPLGLGSEVRNLRSQALVVESSEANARLPNPAALVRSMSRRERTGVNWLQQFMKTPRLTASRGVRFRCSSARLRLAVKQLLHINKLIRRQDHATQALPGFDASFVRRCLLGDQRLSISFDER